MKTWSGVLAMLVLAACAGTVGTPKLEPGKSTAKDVAKQMGEPALVIDQTGGGRVEYFTTFPYGRVTHAVTLGADGVVRGMAQCLTQDNLQKVKAGMKRSEVLALLGPPRRETPDARGHETILEYPWLTGNARKRITWVHVGANGTVTEVVEREDFEAEPSE